MTANFASTRPVFKIAEFDLDVLFGIMCSEEVELVSLKQSSTPSEIESVAGYPGILSSQAVFRMAGKKYED